MGDKVRELTAAQPGAQLPEVLLHALLAHLAASPAKFANEHAALRAADPRLKPGAGPEDGSQPDSTSDQRQPSVEEIIAMADTAKPRSLASLMEELGYQVTSSVSAVQGLLTKVSLPPKCCVPASLSLLCAAFFARERGTSGLADQAPQLRPAFHDRPVMQHPAP